MLDCALIVTCEATTFRAVTSGAAHQGFFSHCWPDGVSPGNLDRIGPTTSLDLMGRGRGEPVQSMQVQSAFCPLSMRTPDLLFNKLVPFSHKLWSELPSDLSLYRCVNHHLKESSLFPGPRQDGLQGAVVLLLLLQMLPCPEETTGSVLVSMDPREAIWCNWSHRYKHHWVPSGVVDIQRKLPLYPDRQWAAQALSGVSWVYGKIGCVHPNAQAREREWGGNRPLLLQSIYLFIYTRVSYAEANAPGRTCSRRGINILGFI